MPVRPGQNGTNAPRILVLSDGLEVGGAERQIALLLKYLPNSWPRRVWSMNDGPFAMEICKAGIPVSIKLRAWRLDPFPALHLWSLIRNWKPSVVHSFGHMCTLAAIPACRILRIPLINGTIRHAHI